MQEDEAVPQKTLPDRIADQLIGRIFTGELAAGDRLPGERELAQELGVDRTSLRMALRQLIRMNLVRAVRGSGITVLDYAEHAGIDLLATVFANPELELGASFQLEALDQYILAMAQATGIALSRATPAQLMELDALLLAQVRALDRSAKLDELAELDVRLHDAITRLHGNTIARLLANSTRPLRRRMVALFYETIDVRTHIDTMRAKLRNQMAGSADPESISRGLRAYLLELTRPLRERIAQLHPEPRKRSSS